MECPNCHAENEEDAQFCKECGADLQAASASEGPLGEFKLAGRGARLGAKLIDEFAYVIPIVISAVLGPAFGIVIVLLALAAVLAIVILQVVWLTKDGQTIGKKALGMRVVSVETGENGEFVKNVVLRAWVNSVLSIIPPYALVDILLIFRKEKQCIHDLIAGTRVVKA